MYAVVPHTSKALVTTLCGYWPPLGLDVPESRPDALALGCLPRLLRSAGWRTLFLSGATARFEDAATVVHQLGFEEHFSEETLDGTGFEKVGYFGWEDRALVRAGVEWSRREPGRPFLAVYQTNVSHHPYVLPEAWTRRDFPGKTGREADYLNAIAYVDTMLGELVEAYRAAGLADNTVFVALGDHGESVGEHGMMGHDLVVREEGLHIPFVMWGAPLGHTGTIEGVRQQIDVVPTLLQVAGLRLTSGAFPGASLLGPPPAGPRYFACWGAHRCVGRREADTFILDDRQAGRLLRFDLSNDPEETAGVTADDVAIGQDLRRWEARVQTWYRHAEAYGAHQRLQPSTPGSVAPLGGGLALAGCDGPPRPTGPALWWLTCRVRLAGPIGAPVEVRAGWNRQEPDLPLGRAVVVDPSMIKEGYDLILDVPLEVSAITLPTDVPTLRRWDGGPIGDAVPIPLAPVH
jgi:hypothetical protein